MVTISCHRAFYRSFVPQLWLWSIFVAILIVGIARGSVVQVATGSFGAALVVTIYGFTVAQYRSRVFADPDAVYLPRTFRSATAVPTADIEWIGLIRTRNVDAMGYNGGWRSWMTTTDGHAVCLISAFYPKPTKSKGGQGAEAFAATVRASPQGQFVSQLWAHVYDAQGPNGALATGQPRSLTAARVGLWSGAPGSHVMRVSKRPSDVLHQDRP